MKIIICFFLIFASIDTLVSQSVDLELRMHPEINKLEFNNDPRILLLEDAKNRFIFFDPYKRSLIEANENNFVFSGEKTLNYGNWFWYPHTKSSYLYRPGGFPPTDPIPRGWFELVWNSQKSMVEAELQDNWGLVDDSPPIVKMLDSRYEMITSPGVDKEHNDTQRIIIREVETGKVYLDNFLRLKYSFHYAYLWIGDTLILEDRTHLFLTAEPYSKLVPEYIKSLSDLNSRINTSLYNFVSGYHVSFYPEIIIGYGAGYVITTGSDFIGLRIWDLSGTVVYSDEDNTLFKQIRQKYRGGKRLILELSYFDNPFVYIPFLISFYPSLSGCFIINLQTDEITVLGRDELEDIDSLSGVIRTE